MKSETEVLSYLAEAENNALLSLAANKWERFGYWASQTVHLRRILGLSSAPTPFRQFAALARQTLDRQEQLSPGNPKNTLKTPPPTAQSHHASRRHDLYWSQEGPQALSRSKYQGSKADIR